MSEEKKEPWLNYLALTTVIFAVCATLATFKSAGFSTKGVMNQAQASDQWAYFQAKSIRESLYRIQKENLELEISTLNDGKNPARLQQYEKALKQAETSIQKYDKEKKEIQVAAHQLEQARDEAQKNGKQFGFAIIFFQIAILLSSIAGLLKRKEIWYMALPLGSLGIVYFSNGFLLFF